MRCGAIAFLIGILCLQALPALPAQHWVLALPGLLAAAILVRRIRWLAWAAVGFLWALWWALGVVKLPAELSGVDLWVEGWIVSIPEQEGRRIRFEFDVAQARRNDFPIDVLAGQRLRLSWWDDADSGESPLMPTPPKLQVGDRWGFATRLQPPHGLANPGGFDYERWLFAKGIVATGSIRNEPTPQRLAAAERYPIDQYRQQMAEQFQQQLPHNPLVGILIALAVGDEGRIAPWQWEVFNRTGVGHLMSVSGSHIGLVAGMVFGLVLAVWRRIPKLALWQPAMCAAALAALVGAGAYTLLSGLSVPAQRSFLMAAVGLLAVILQRPAVPSRILALALFTVLIVDPSAPLMAGFWLSFSAVAIILYSSSGRWRQQHWFGQSLRLQFAITVALLPLTLGFFQQFPLLSPIANLMAIPWVGCTVLPLSLLAAVLGQLSPTLQWGLLKLAAVTMEGLWQILAGMERWPGLVWHRPAPPVWALALASLGLFVLLAPRGLTGRWLGLPLCLPLLWPPLNRPEAGEFWLTLLDVGPGLAAVVQTEQHVLVYDTGPRLSSTLDAGRGVLVPFLRQQGVAQVDSLVVSHDDKQHSGGVRSLRELMPVERILTAAVEVTPIAGAVPCRAGQTWNWDGVQFRLLHPPEQGFRGDNGSCVLQVKSPAGSLLLPGDIETAAETALLATYDTELAADVLVAPHHGQRPLSLPAFVEAVQPRYVLFATGYHNRFGYPRPETRASYQASGATLLDVSQEGALTFRWKIGEPLIVERYREQHHHYWNTP